MGPLITREHRDRVARISDTAAAEGATIAVDGRKDPATRARDSSWGLRCIDQREAGDALLRPGNIWTGAERGARRYLC